MTRHLLRLSAALLPLALFYAVSVLAATAGPTMAGAGANNPAAGTFAWSNPGFITANDASNATGTSQTGSPTQYLVASSFGFSVPAGATINGIVVQIDRYSSSASFECKDLDVKIRKADGTFGAQNKAAATTWPTASTVASYGGAADLWGETWTVADVNDPDFGVALRSANVDTTGQANVDYVAITVHYTEAGGGSASDKSYGFIY